MATKRPGITRPPVRPVVDLSALTIEERERLALAPVGTPGLDHLGLTDPDASDLLAPGPAYVAAAAAAQQQYLLWRMGRGSSLQDGDMATFARLLATVLQGQQGAAEGGGA